MIIVRGLRLLMLALLAVAAADPARAGSGNDRKAEIEFQSYTPDGLQDVLSGSWKTGAAKISGTLILPEGQGPFPAVIAYHSSVHRDEMQDWFNDLVPALNAAGIAAFLPDSYSGRKIGRSSSKDQGKLSRAARLVDAFMALETIAARPEIDASRIGITGYSWGGIISMNSAHTGLAKAVLGDGPRFKAHLPVYASCRAQFENLTMTGAPMLFLSGSMDDQAPARDCDSLVKRLKAAGFKADLKVYSGAHHGWIRDYKISRCDDCMNFGACGEFRIHDDGYESTLDGSISSRDGWSKYIKRVFKECGTRGTTSGKNPEARADTIRTTVAFFAENL